MLVTMSDTPKKRGRKPDPESKRSTGADRHSDPRFTFHLEKDLLQALDDYCASFPHKGGRIRLESVQNANDQAATAAHTVAGQHKPYAALPWFWSDQYDCKLQIAGLNSGYDQAVVRPGKTERSRSVWYYREGRLLAVDAMADAAAFVTAKKLLERGASVPPEQAADPASEFRTWGL